MENSLLKNTMNNLIMTHLAIIELELKKQNALMQLDNKIGSKNTPDQIVVRSFDDMEDILNLESAYETIRFNWSTELSNLKIFIKELIKLFPKMSENIESDTSIVFNFEYNAMHYQIVIQSKKESKYFRFKLLENLNTKELLREIDYINF